MKLISTVIIPLAALISVASAIKVQHGSYYDHRWNRPAVCQCFDSLRSPLWGRLFFRTVPSWPYIGGSDAVKVITDVGCGSCWHISYEGKSINITAVDTAMDGFTLSGKAMDALTDNRKAVIDATATKVDKKYCKL